MSRGRSPSMLGMHHPPVVSPETAAAPPPGGGNILNVMILACAMVTSFLAGTMVHLSRANNNCENTCPSASAAGLLNGTILVTDRVKTTTTQAVGPPQTMMNVASAMARTPKSAFMKHLDLGVPHDEPQGTANRGAGSDNVLLLYQQKSAIPSELFPLDGPGRRGTNEIPLLVDTPSALDRCDHVNVVLTSKSNRNQCIAIVPQYESYHVQKWMRVNDKNQRLNSSASLKLVPRAHEPNGMNHFRIPAPFAASLHKKILQSYLAKEDAVLNQLKPVLQRIAAGNTVIVMVCNFGQSELLMNFVCNAKSRGHDLSNVIVFATDRATHELVSALGLASFYLGKIYGDVPVEAAQVYGDVTFKRIMMAKVLSAHLVAKLGYDFLFQDVDVVWYDRNPLAYFQRKGGDGGPAGGEKNKFDMFFQDDGARSARYAPYAANSGFYFVRNNERTRYLFASVLMSGDLVISTASHQQVLIATMNEHVGLFGLRVKVLNDDDSSEGETLFPSGYQYNEKSSYMRKFLAGKTKPYIFHMSWTRNKDDKIKYMQQMGAWFVRDKCIGKKAPDIKMIGSSTTKDHPPPLLLPACCSAKPLLKCHYKDKPSLKPCKDSPPQDEGNPSFWK